MKPKDVPSQELLSNRGFIKRFFSKISRGLNPDDCWQWKAAKHERGYGQIATRSGLIRAHRASYLLHHGDIPSGLQVMHSCNNPECCNPLHLAPGTNADNARYKSECGRAAMPKGESSPCAKLTNKQAREIKELLGSSDYTQSEIGLMFGVSQSTVRDIKKGRCYVDA